LYAALASRAGTSFRSDDLPPPTLGGSAAYAKDARPQYRIEYEIQVAKDGPTWKALFQADSIASARSDLERIIKELAMPRSCARVVKRIITEQIVIWAGAD
jgi:hypothetical protein